MSDESNSDSDDESSLPAGPVHLSTVRNSTVGNSTVCNSAAGSGIINSNAPSSSMLSTPGSWSIDESYK